MDIGYGLRVRKDVLEGVIGMRNGGRAAEETTIKHRRTGMVRLIVGLGNC
jgi:hypothetical protein